MLRPETDLFYLFEVKFCDHKDYNSPEGTLSMEAQDVFNGGLVSSEEALSKENKDARQVAKGQDAKASFVKPTIVVAEVCKCHVDANAKPIATSFMGCQETTSAPTCRMQNDVMCAWE